MCSCLDVASLLGRLLCVPHTQTVHCVQVKRDDENTQKEPSRQ